MSLDPGTRLDFYRMLSPSHRLAKDVLPAASRRDLHGQRQHTLTLGGTPRHPGTRTFTSVTLTDSVAPPIQVV